MIKKIIIGFLIGAVVLIGACVAYIIIYFQNIDGVSIGTKIEQSQTDKPALLVIDIQEGITGKLASKMTKSMVQQSGPFIKKVNQAITMAKGKNIPVIYIRQENKDRFFNILSKNFLAQGDPSAALDSRVTVVDGPVFTKTKMDAFSNPELDTYLQSKKINHLYVTGLSALACVDRTIRAALHRGYTVTAVADAIIGEKVKEKEVKCREWADANARVVEADELR